MVNRCVAAGCSNTPSDRVSLFRFPKDKVLRNKWEKQVQRTRAKWKVTEHSYLCSEHFTEDSFEVDSEIASKFGLKKRRRLKSGAIPTIFHRPPVLEQTENQQVLLHRKRPSSGKSAVASTSTTATSDEPVTKKKRGAVEKERDTR